MTPCTGCAGELRPDDRFCATCGAPASATPVGVSGAPVPALPPVVPVSALRIDVDPEPSASDVLTTRAPRPRATETAVLLPPIQPVRRPPGDRKVAGVAALAASVTQVLVLVLPPLGPFGLGAHLWSVSALRSTWSVVVEGANEGHIGAGWWLLAACVVATAASLVASVVALSGRSRGAGGWLVGAGLVAVITGSAIPHYFDSYSHAGFTPWALMASGGLMVLAGIGVLARQRPAGDAIQGLSMLGVLALVVTGLIAIPAQLHDSDSSDVYAAPTTTVPVAPVTPTEAPTTTAPSTTDQSGSGEPLTTSYTVTEDEPDGDTFDVTVSFGAPEHITSELSEDGLSYDPSCVAQADNSASPATDAVVPATITLTNETEGSATPVTDFTTTEGVSAVEAGFSAGTSCNSSGFDLYSAEPLDAGQSSTTALLFVIGGYFPGDSTEPNATVLDEASLTFESAADNTTGADATPQSISGPGVQDSSNTVVPLSGSYSGDPDAQ